MIKLAALCSWLCGLGFGIPGAYGIWSLLNGKGIARVMGFPTYGYGPFEKIGVHTTVPLMITFFMVCVLECVSGWLLWSGSKSAAIFSLVLVPVEMVFYIGFALPFGPPFVLIRILLLVFNWSSLH